MEHLAQLVCHVVGLVKIPTTTEKAAQDEIEAILSGIGIPYQREYKLSAADRPDFMVAGSVAVEVKVMGSEGKVQIFNQLKRYAIHPEVKALVLITGKSMGLPMEIEGKPVYFLALGKKWL